MTDAEREKAELAELQAELHKDVVARAGEKFPGLPSGPLTMDPRPSPMMRPREDRGSKTSPLPPATGPVETFMGQQTDVSDPKAAEGMDNTKAFMGFLGGASGGAIAGKAASLLPGISALAGSAKLAPRLAGAAIEGTAGGAGATTGSALAQGHLPTGKELAAGAAMGGAMGVGGKLLGEAVTHAPQREATAILRDAKATGMTPREFGRFFASKEGVNNTIGKDPELRAALGDPEKLTAVLSERTPVAKAAAIKVMDAVDATNGRIPVVDVNKAIGSVFHALEKSGGTQDANPAAAAAYKLLQQFSSGIGKDHSHPPSTADLRRFLTDEVGSKLNTNPNTEDSAVDRAASLVYGKLKDLIDSHAEKAGPRFAKEIHALNEQQSTYALLEQTAARKLPDAVAGAPTKTAGWMNPIATAARVGVGAGVGRTVAHFSGVEPEVGQAVGGALGAVAPAVKAAAQATGKAATTALANSPTAQKVGPAIEPLAELSAHVLIPKVMSARRAREEAHRGSPADAAAFKAAQERADQEERALREHVADAVYGKR